MMTPFLPRMSIRRTLVVITGALTFMTALLAGHELMVKAERLENMTNLRRVTQLTSDLFVAIESLALERDVALSLLSARDAHTRDSLRMQLEASRRDNDTRLRAALTALEAEGVSDVEPLIARIRAGSEAVGALRVEIDQAMTLDDPRRRDSTLPARWSDSVSDLMMEGDSLWVAFVRPYANVDPIVTQQLRFDHFLRTIFDYSGRERALIAQILAERRRATPAQTAELFRGDGILQLSWSTSRLLAQQSGLYTAIEPTYLDAKSNADIIHGMLQDTFYTPGSANQGAFPLSPSLWLELSQQSLATLDALRQEARGAMRTRVDGLMADIRTAMAVQAFVLLLALMLGALCFSVIFARIIIPIRDIVRALEAAARGERASFQRQLGGKDDEIGKLAAVLQVFQSAMDDVRSTAAELDRSERRMRAVVDNAVDGLITIDAKGVIQSFNPACERIFGYMAREVIGLNVSLLMPESERAHHDGYLGNYAGSGEARAIGTSGRELLGQRKNGSIFPIDLSICGVRLPEGQYFAGFIRDISQRKQAEQEINDYTLALERSNKELDDFAYIASHDLKEPLRGMHNHARFLMEDNVGKLDEESTNRLQRVVYLSQRMERLVNDLLYFSRLGRQDLAVQATDLNDVIADISGTLDHFLKEENAIIKMPKPLPRVVCDKTRVGEAFRNLITNAVKYNESAEKIIEIGVAPKRTPSGLHATRVFYVADNGLGIPPEFHQDVFRIFKRLQGRTTEKDGTGVGLTFVKKIVERHGGEIWVESEPGKGSTFYFTLGTPDERRDATRRAA